MGYFAGLDVSLEETAICVVDGAGQMSLLPNVAREMVRRGFSDNEIAKILGGNLVRVFEENQATGRTRTAK